jgi:hypothetical protein
MVRFQGAGEHKKKNMRKIIIAFITSIFFTGCYTTIQAPTYTDYKECMDKIESELYEMDYELSGSSRNTNNDIYVAGYTYSKYSGVNSVLNNNYIVSDKYTFSNSAGNTLDFNISYRVWRADNEVKTIFLTDIYVPQCKTSNQKDYYKLCGNGSPIYSIKKMPQRNMKKYDPVSTELAVYGTLILVGGVLLLLII